MAKVQVKEYRKSKNYEKDAKRMGRRGWTVVSVVQEKRPAGCARWALIGFLAPLMPARPLIVVTYSKD